MELGKWIMKVMPASKRKTDYNRLYNAFLDGLSENRNVRDLKINPQDIELVMFDVFDFSQRKCRKIVDSDHEHSKKNVESV